MKRSHWIALALLAGLSAPAAADILLPGTKWVSHHVRFENLADFPDYHFYLSPRPERRFGQDLKEKNPEVVEIDLRPLAPDAEESLSGNPIEGPKWLFAVPKKLLPDPAKEQPRAIWFAGDHPGILKIELMSGRRSAPQSEKRELFLTVYRVGIDGDKLTATVVRDDQPSGEVVAAEGGDAPAGDDSEPGLRRAVIGGSIAIAAVALGLFLYFRKKG